MSPQPRTDRELPGTRPFSKDARQIWLIQWLLILGALGWFQANVYAANQPRSSTRKIPDAQKPAPTSIEKLSERIKKSVVVVSQTGRGNSGTGVGAGFIISDDGLIATCLHVIGEGRPIQVRLADGTEAAVVEVHAWDRKMDLAILRIGQKKTKPLEFGDSDFLPQGTDVVAMGSPQGLDYSIVQGIVSARRVIDHQNFIQIAIPIESGNSGGPLLDRSGRVHGILTMKSLLTPNLGFAIPINSVKKLLETPNPVPIHRWLAMTQLDPSEWTPHMGASWTQKGGRLVVQGLGDGFGGRALCFYQKEKPSIPYEVAVTVKLQDESGAAGLIFGADGSDQHYGFYPTAGQVRLTRFEGPNVYTWTIVKQISSPHYRPGDWNRLRVRVEKDKVICFVNEHLVLESAETSMPGRTVGLAKFRDTSAEFKHFAVGSDLRQAEVAELSPALWQKLDGLNVERVFDRELVQSISAETNAPLQLLAKAEQLEQQAAKMRLLSRFAHRKKVEKELIALLSGPEPSINLTAAALIVAWLDDPELHRESYEEIVQKMAAEIRKKSDAQKNPREKLEILRHYLFQENGFHGSRSDYYNKSNSYLNDVLDDREGLPITLGILMMELARQIGVDLAGIPVPGHFMVGMPGKNGEWLYLDPFEGGEEKSRAELEALVFESQGSRLQAEHLKPATRKQIVTRMIRNLLGIALENQSAESSLAYLDLLLAIEPGSAADRWTRGNLRAQLGDRTGAREDLEWLMENKPAGLNLREVEGLLDSLR